jgi:hypothetical protein
MVPGSRGPSGPWPPRARVPRTASAEGRECRGAQAPTIPGPAGARCRHAGVPQGRRTGVPPRSGSATPENRGIPVPTAWGSPGRGSSRTDARGCRRPRVPTPTGADVPRCRGSEVLRAESSPGPAIPGTEGLGYRGAPLKSDHQERGSFARPITVIAACWSIVPRTRSASRGPAPRGSASGWTRRRGTGPTASRQRRLLLERSPQALGPSLRFWFAHARHADSPGRPPSRWPAGGCWGPACGTPRPGTGPRSRPPGRPGPGTRGGIGVASSWVCVSLRTSSPRGALHFPGGGA